ncbi:MAG: nicotinate (nicotinamide) nucleotide adenylyltransferase [Eubacteriales bacterium]|nr:nicotinate (nicotinamide) nucleotide adenylyltransferase [Eubacteriales bacterium]
MERVALFGGSFDPVHNGHLYMARKVLESGLVDRLELIPLKAPWHKKLASSARHRVNMLKAAIEGEKGMSINLMELRRPGMTYTADTVRILKKKYPQNRYYYVIGDDSLGKLDTWHDAAYLLKAVPFIAVYRRADVERERVRERLREEFGAEIVLLETGVYDLSSTEVRAAAAEGRSLEGMVPEKVAAYIKERKLYGAR